MNSSKNAGNTNAEDGSQAPISVVLKTVQKPLSAPSKSSPGYIQQPQANHLGVCSNNEVQYVCCGRLYPTSERYKSHLIERSRCDPHHEMKLVEMGQQRCSICSVWVQKNNMDMHLRKYHGVIKVTKSSKAVSTVPQTGGGDERVVPPKSRKNYVIKVSGQSLASAGQSSTIGHVAGKSQCMDISEASNKPSLKFIAASSGNVYPKFQLKSAVGGGTVGKVIVYPSGPKSGVPMVTYGPRTIMKSNSRALAPKNGVAYSGAGISKLIPGNTPKLQQGKNVTSKTVNGVTTLQISGGNIIPGTSANPLSKIKMKTQNVIVGQKSLQKNMISNNASKSLQIIDQKKCPSKKVNLEDKELSGLLDSVNSPIDSQLKDRETESELDLKSGISRLCDKSGLLEKEAETLNNSKPTPGSEKGKNKGKKYKMLQLYHSDDLLDSPVVKKETNSFNKQRGGAIKKPGRKRKESKAKQNEVKLSEIPSEVVGDPMHPRNLVELGEKDDIGVEESPKPPAGKKRRKQVIKPVLEPKEDGNFETPLTSKVKVRKRVKSASCLENKESNDPGNNRKAMSNPPANARRYRRQKENEGDGFKSTPKTSRGVGRGRGGRRGGLKKRGVGRPGRPRKSGLGGMIDTPDMTHLDSLFEDMENEDVENEPVLVPKIVDDDADIPTVELEMFTLPSLNNNISVLLTDPHNPDFKVYASMDAIFVGDSALGDVTNQIGYVTDINNVVFVSPHHFLFPNVEELDKFVPKQIVTMKEKGNISPQKVCRLNSGSKISSVGVCKENYLMRSPKVTSCKGESPSRLKSPGKTFADYDKSSKTNRNAESTEKDTTVTEDDPLVSVRKKHVSGDKSAEESSSENIRVRRRSSRLSGEKIDDDQVSLNEGVDELPTKKEVNLKKSLKSSASKLKKANTPIALNDNQLHRVECSKEIKIMISPLKSEYLQLVDELKLELKKSPVKIKRALTFSNDSPESAENTGSSSRRQRTRTKSAESVSCAKVSDGKGRTSNDDSPLRNGHLKSESDILNSDNSGISGGLSVSRENVSSNYSKSISADGGNCKSDSENVYSKLCDDLTEKERRKSLRSGEKNVANPNTDSCVPVEEAANVNTSAPIVGLTENSVIQGKNSSITSVVNVLRNRPMRERRPSSKWLESIAFDKQYKRQPKLRTERSSSDTSNVSSLCRASVSSCANDNEVIFRPDIADEGSGNEKADGVRSLCFNSDSNEIKVPSGKMDNFGTYSGDLQLSLEDNKSVDNCETVMVVDKKNTEVDAGKRNSEGEISETADIGESAQYRIKKKLMRSRSKEVTIETSNSSPLTLDSEGKSECVGEDAEPMPMSDVTSTEILSIESDGKVSEVLGEKGVALVHTELRGSVSPVGCSETTALKEIQIPSEDLMISLKEKESGDNCETVMFVDKKNTEADAGEKTSDRVVARNADVSEPTHHKIKKRGRPRRERLTTETANNSLIENSENALEKAEEPMLIIDATSIVLENDENISDFLGENIYAPNTTELQKDDSSLDGDAPDNTELQREDSSEDGDAPNDTELQREDSSEDEDAPDDIELQREDTTEDGNVPNNTELQREDSSVDNNERLMVPSGETDNYDATRDLQVSLEQKELGDATRDLQVSLKQNELRDVTRDLQVSLKQNELGDNCETMMVVDEKDIEIDAGKVTGNVDVVESPQYMIKEKRLRSRSKGITSNGTTSSPIENLSLGSEENSEYIQEKAKESMYIGDEETSPDEILYSLENDDMISELLGENRDTLIHMELQRGETPVVCKETLTGHKERLVPSEDLKIPLKEDEFRDNFEAEMVVDEKNTETDTGKRISEIVVTGNDVGDPPQYRRKKRRGRARSKEITTEITNSCQKEKLSLNCDISNDQILSSLENDKRVSEVLEDNQDAVIDTELPRIDTLVDYNETLTDLKKIEMDISNSFGSANEYNSSIVDTLVETDVQKRKSLEKEGRSEVVLNLDVDKECSKSIEQSNDEQELILSDGDDKRSTELCSYHVEEKVIPVDLCSDPGKEKVVPVDFCSDPGKEKVLPVDCHDLCISDTSIEMDLLKDVGGEAKIDNSVKLKKIKINQKVELRIHGALVNDDPTNELPVAGESKKGRKCELKADTRSSENTELPSEVDEIKNNKSEKSNTLEENNKIIVCDDDSEISDKKKAKLQKESTSSRETAANRGSLRSSPGKKLKRNSFDWLTKDSKNEQKKPSDTKEQNEIANDFSNVESPSVRNSSFKVIQVDDEISIILKPEQVALTNSMLENSLYSMVGEEEEEEDSFSGQVDENLKETEKHMYEEPPRDKVVEREDSDIHEESKDSDIHEGSKDSDIHEESKDSDIHEESKDSDIHEESKDSDIHEESKDSDIHEESKDSDIHEESKDCDIHEESKDSDIHEESNKISSLERDNVKGVHEHERDCGDEVDVSRKDIEEVPKEVDIAVSKERSEITEAEAEKCEMLSDPDIALDSSDEIKESSSEENVAIETGTKDEGACSSGLETNMKRKIYEDSEVEKFGDAGFVVDDNVIEDESTNLKVSSNENSKGSESQQESVSETCSYSATDAEALQNLETKELKNCLKIGEVEDFEGSTENKLIEKDDVIVDSPLLIVKENANSSLPTSNPDKCVSSPIRKEKYKKVEKVNDKFSASNTMSVCVPKSPISSSSPKGGLELSPPREWHGRGAKLKAQVLIQDMQTGVTDSHIVSSSHGLEVLNKEKVTSSALDMRNIISEKTKLSVEGTSDTEVQLLESHSEKSKMHKSPSDNCKVLKSPGECSKFQRDSGSSPNKSPRTPRVSYEDREWQARGAKLKAKVMISDQQNGHSDTMVDLPDNLYFPIIKSPPAKKLRRDSGSNISMRDIRSFFTSQKSPESIEISPKSCSSKRTNSPGNSPFAVHKSPESIETTPKSCSRKTNSQCISPSPSVIAVQKSQKTVEVTPKSSSSNRTNSQGNSPFSLQKSSESIETTPKSCSFNKTSSKGDSPFALQKSPESSENTLKACSSNKTNSQGNSPVAVQKSQEAVKITSKSCSSNRTNSQGISPVVVQKSQESVEITPKSCSSNLTNSQGNSPFSMQESPESIETMLKSCSSKKTNSKSNSSYAVQKSLESIETTLKSCPSDQSNSQGDSPFSMQKSQESIETTPKSSSNRTNSEGNGLFSKSKRNDRKSPKLSTLKRTRSIKQSPKNANFSKCRSSEGSSDLLSPIVNKDETATTLNTLSSPAHSSTNSPASANAASTQNFPSDSEIKMSTPKTPKLSSSFVSNEASGSGNSSINHSTPLKSPPAITSPQSYRRRKVKLYSVTSSDIRTFFSPITGTKRKRESSPSLDICKAVKSEVETVKAEEETVDLEEKMPMEEVEETVNVEKISMEEVEETVNVEKIPMEEVKQEVEETVNVEEEMPIEEQTLPKTDESAPEVLLQVTYQSTSVRQARKYRSKSLNFEGFNRVSRQSSVRTKTLMRVISLIEKKNCYRLGNFPFPLDQLCDWDDEALDDRIFDKHS